MGVWGEGNVAGVPSDSGAKFNGMAVSEPVDMYHSLCRPQVTKLLALLWHSLLHFGQHPLTIGGKKIKGWVVVFIAYRWKWG